jgi:hypothetical protein
MAAAAKQARKRSDDRTARTEAEQRHADRQIGQVVPDREREQARQRDLECQQSRGGEEDRRIQADMRLRPPAFHDDRPGYDRRLRGGESSLDASAAERNWRPSIKADHPQRRMLHHRPPVSVGRERTRPSRNADDERGSATVVNSSVTMQHLCSEASPGYSR